MARATKLANLKNKMPIGKIKIAKFYVNKANGQISILLPRRKLKSLPVKGEFIYW